MFLGEPVLQGVSRAGSTRCFWESRFYKVFLGVPSEQEAADREDSFVSVDEADGLSAVCQRSPITHLSPLKAQRRSALSAPRPPATRTQVGTGALKHREPDPNQRVSLVDSICDNV